MSKQKKQLVTILSLCLVLVVAGIGYVVASNYQKDKEKKEETEETEEIKLYSLQQDDVTKLHFVNASHEMTLVKEDDVWKDASDADFPVNQDYVNAMLEDVATMTATKLVVENPENLEQYELKTPNYTIELTDKDGTTKMLAIGLESAAAEGCYAYVDQADKIYTIASHITGDFDYTRNQMMAVPDAPEISAEYVTYYSMKPNKGKQFIARYSEKNAKYSDMEGWDIIGPYAGTVPGSQEALQGLFAGLANMASGEGVAYHSTEELLKKYGLKTPACVLEVDYYTLEGGEVSEETGATPSPEEQKKIEHHYQLSIGAMDDTEENYYVSVDGHDGIYLMAADTIDALMDVNAFDYVCKNMHKPQMEQLQSISFTYQGKKHEITVTKKEVENGISEDGSTVYDYTIILDGKTELDEHSFIPDYNSIFSSLVYSKELSAKKKKEMLSADMTIVTNQGTTELTFSPYDKNNFYEVHATHGIEDYTFLADINVVNNAMEQLLSMKTLEEAKAEEAQASESP